MSSAADLSSLDLESEEDWLTGLQNFISEVTSSGSNPLSALSSGTGTGFRSGSLAGPAVDLLVGEVRTRTCLILF